MHEQPVAERLFVGLAFTPFGGRIEQVVCDARVGRKQLRVVDAVPVSPAPRLGMVPDESGRRRTGRT